MTLEKTCKKHGVLDEKFIKKEPSIQYAIGYYLRCLKCRNEQRWRSEKDIKTKKQIDRNLCAKHGFEHPDEIKTNGRCKICHRESANRKRNTCLITKTARNARVARLRSENPEKYREMDKRHKLAWMPKGYRFREVLKLRGLTHDQYEKLVKEHDDKCAICGQQETRKCSKNLGKISRLVIDHCHATNNVRGLLCHACNVAIGSFKENTEIMLNAIAYVEHWKSI